MRIRETKKEKRVGETVPWTKITVIEIVGVRDRVVRDRERKVTWVEE